ncbi:MAG: hypothetical protein SCARUB_01865 [Candidatus Scalindua rubra]|uniref:Uncharacterized protein n=1 Tax=Candidatus Scalindua rubra TaxID=1872076 RepID=A0A1E3XBK4_9BACT|nr:MAG: hypothetical protein SCARUB_01865 [Candidatus Scalindua rubra]
MTRVQKIEKEVSKMSPEELAQFRAWFEEFDAALWDKRFEEDAKARKLDTVAKKAIADFKKGNFKEL